MMHHQHGGDEESVDFPVLDGCSDIASVDLKEISEQLMMDEEHSIFDKISDCLTDLLSPLNSNQLHDITKLCLCLLVFPLALFAD